MLGLPGPGSAGRGSSGKCIQNCLRIREALQLICSEGVPQETQKQLREVEASGYAFDMCGHDFLSYTGFTNGRSSHVKQLDSNETIIDETSALERFLRETKASEFRLSLGPAGGAFFADAYRQKRYRWANLPVDLEETVQDVIVAAKGYGSIHRVAMNAAGGWVLLLAKGKKYLWGGELPVELVTTLAMGSKKAYQIHVMFSSTDGTNVR